MKYLKYIIASLLALPIITSAVTLPTGSLLYWGGTNFNGTTSPVVGYITATSSSASILPIVLITSGTTTNWAITGVKNAILSTDANGSIVATTTGAGTVTSVDMSVPTGLSISGNPVTSNGTLALTLTSGYVIPLTASTTQWKSAYDIVNASSTKWDEAYSWGNHALAGYLTNLLGGLNAILGNATTTNATTTTMAITSLGTPTGAFLAVNPNGTVIATTTPNSGIWGNITGTISGQTDLWAYLTRISSASTTNWNGFYDVPSTRITAGTNLSWSGNTLNATGGTAVNDWQVSSGSLTPTTTIAVSLPSTLTVSATTTTNNLVVNDGGTGTTTLVYGDIGRPFCNKYMSSDGSTWIYQYFLPTGVATTTTTSCQ